MKPLVGLFLVLSVAACRTDFVDIAVSFDSPDGLQREDRVLFEDNPAGKIEKIEYRSDGTYLVHLKIDREFSKALTEYAQFQIISDPGQPGHKAVEIDLIRTGGKRLPDGAVVKGTARRPLLSPLLEKDLEAGLKFIREQIDRLAREIRQIPESEAYQQLKKTLSDLADEISRSEEKTRQKLKKEWLPQIEKDLEALKRRMREFGQEDEARPLETELDRIRNI